MSGWFEWCILIIFLNDGFLDGKPFFSKSVSLVNFIDKKFLILKYKR